MDLDQKKADFAAEMGKVARERALVDETLGDMSEAELEALRQQVLALPGTPAFLAEKYPANSRMLRMLMFSTHQGVLDFQPRK